MKKMKLSLLAVAALFSTNLLHAQTADDIIAKHLDAVGGKDKLKSISSMYTEMTTEVMNNSSDAKVTLLTGKGYKTETSFNGQDIVSVITDKGGWMINPMTGSSDAQNMPDDQYKMQKEQIYVGEPFLNYPANGYKAALQGTEKVGDVNAYKLQFTSPDGMSFTDDIDPNTYYILQTTASVEGQDYTVSFSDFTKTDFGYTMPYTINRVMPQFTIAIKVTKVTFNQPVDPKIFDMPK